MSINTSIGLSVLKSGKALLPRHSPFPFPARVSNNGHKKNIPQYLVYNIEVEFWIKLVCL
jgi:hypothetical protein